MRLPSISMRTDGSGFTLVEVLVALALFSVIAGLGLFASMDMYRGDSLRDERDTIVALLDRARTHAMNGRYGLSHGLCLDETSGTYAVFRGSYAPDTVEESSPRGKSVVVTGIPPCSAGGIIFTQLSGTTTESTVTLTSGSETAKILVNQEGAILW